MREIRLIYFNLYTTVKDLKKNIIFILLAIWFGFSASRMYCNYFETKSYTSEITLAVNYNGYSSATSSSAIKSTIEYAEKIANMFNDTTLIDIISEKSGTPVTSRVSAKQMSGTNFISLSCIAYSPQKSYSDLLTILNNQQEITKETFSGITFNVVGNPHVIDENIDSFGDLMLEIESSLLAGFLATTIIVVLSYFRNTIKNESDISNMLGIETFGVVYEEPGSKNSKETYFLSSSNTTSYLFNHSFNQMAIKLESLKRTNNLTSLLITSVFESEGKTTVSTNLAAALAAEGNKVAIVDIDFKRPATYKRFKGVSKTNEHDIARYINGEISIEDVVQFDKESNVYVYCNAKSHKNSLERLRTDIFKKFISELEEEYDFVIFDSSPCGLVSDSEMISGIVSTVLLVVAQDYTEVAAISDTIDNIGEEKILGCVFNRVGEFKRQFKGKLHSFE